jgi:spore coat polysaccharide biosynthesis protein SpsF
MKIVAVIQARTGSSRLPGKVLADVGGRSMLARVVRRAGRAERLDGVVVATTDRPADDAIVAECRELGVTVFRGSEEDVLDRYQGAARATDAGVVVRITSDCPLIDPEVIDRVVAALLADDADYASNTLERTYPRGLDVEAVTAEALAQAWRKAQEPYQRVHVTPYLYQHPDRFRLRSVTSGVDAGHHRWTVDTAEDLELVRALYSRLGNDDDFGWRRALVVVEAEPELADLNRRIRQKALEEG